MNKIIDVSMTLEEGMQTFAAHWHPFYESTQLGRHGIENRETRKITLGTHTGTHIDAPRHFIPKGETIEKIPLEHTCGPATVLDFSELKDFHEITVEDLEREIGKNSKERLIFRFDWDLKALGKRRYYTDHPFLSQSACRWLVNNGCKLIALDTPQPDNPDHGSNNKLDAPNHKILLGNNILIVEYLVNVRQIVAKEVQLFVAPLKIKDGDGAPVRCFVIED